MAAAVDWLPEGEPAEWVTFLRGKRARSRWARRTRDAAEQLAAAIELVEPGPCWNRDPLIGVACRNFDDAFRQDHRP